MIYQKFVLPLWEEKKKEKKKSETHLGEDLIKEFR